MIRVITSSNLAQARKSADSSKEPRSLVVALEDISEARILRRTLNRYMDPQLVAGVMAQGSSIVGKRHEVSVLFSDIRGFTSISETLKPQQVVDLLNSYFNEMLTSIASYNGILDKFIGDAVMALYGVPLALTDDHGPNKDALSSCLSALDMQERLAKFNESMANDPGLGFTLTEPLKVGIGINTGECICGNIGSDKRMDYTVCGDEVNLASRVESITKYYDAKILITECTYSGASQELKDEDLEPLFVRELDIIVVAGKKKHITIYELLAENADKLKHTEWIEKTRIYEEARSAYLLQNWEEAIRLFRQTIDVTGVDLPSSRMIDRCQTYMVEPPGKDWEGVWVMSGK